MNRYQSGAVKYFLILLGILFVAIGIIGIIVPGLPTTIFLIAAAACFANSSPRLHDWLMNHPWFGPLIKNWHETRSIPKKAKRIALIMMLIAAAYAFVSISDWMIKAVVLVAILIGAIYVYRLPESENFKINQS